MDAMIKVDHQKRQATKISKERQLLRSVLVHVVSALICALICSYSYWFPWLYCLINHFVWIYLPSLWPVVTAPKYMFVVANAIVLVLVNEFRLTKAKSKHPCQDMYEEYVQRSRRHRRALICRKAVRKVEMIEDVKISAQGKIEEMVRETNLNNFVEEKKDEIAAEEILHVRTSAEEKREDPEVNNLENKDGKTIEYTSLNNCEDEESQETFEETEARNSEDKNEEILEEICLNNYSDTKDHDMIAEIESDNCAAEQKTTTPDDAMAHNHNNSYDDQDGDTHEAEESRADDELNKRFEEYIARVIKRRWIEANNWSMCCA